MTASVVNAATVNDEALLAAFRRLSFSQDFRPGRPSGLFEFEVSAEVPTTSLDEAADEYFLVDLPDEVDFLYFLIVETDDLDTDATPAIVFDVIAEDSAGTELVLINDSTIGQAGGTDELDANLPLVRRKLGGQKLGIKIVTAADVAAAGTVTLRGLVSVNTEITTW